MKSFEVISNVAYPEIWSSGCILFGRYYFDDERCGISCGDCTSLKKTLHLQKHMTTPSECGVSSLMEGVTCLVGK